MQLFWEKLSKPYFAVAPMVGNSEEAWRMLSRRYGANILYTEMVHCESFLKGSCNPCNNQWYTTSESDRPLIVQISGSSPQKMLEAALIIQDQCDAIDVNFGCPQKVAKKGGYGAYLQDNWELTAEIIRMLSINLKIPVTCKIRVFECISKTVEYAKMIESAGCSMLAVHGRTRDQKGVMMGLASWDHIKAVKQNLRIPVLSNGNIMSHEDVLRCLEYTECDGVMVGEAHLHNPLVFCKLRGSCLDMIREYIEICSKHPNSAGIRHMKSHLFKLLSVYFKERPEMRPVLDGCDNIEKIKEFYLRLASEAVLSENKDNGYGIYEMRPEPVDLICSIMNESRSL
ncbi:tRNA-dihydrouridine synthase [Ordospora colligata]|uniref:tRNA-dihydrouridine synthase n=1 Tax=Ordospora colligata OC4 TaxID=1354746 RepID=A0A0B2UJ95_9MICR|nr:tRNA-dihydrouridine synthase [Ordospora colligata OC4]KHN69418.1 tRNA-dihydrouridine synthase [Ordospora colligata OC4]TBU14932.1 tRNA-dihydrouridine synthase [Ordospora colligata]TBU15063.1 tRNA-dihydrouridine synthase [Ordospora colligata]TBU18317.1 tRNA-dihydrouridine synthase [Ordospora colligata]